MANKSVDCPALDGERESLQQAVCEPKTLAASAADDDEFTADVSSAFHAAKPASADSRPLQTSTFFAADDRIQAGLLKFL
jgi:hypothetical protein